MSDHAHFRLVDFTEHPLVLLVDGEGNAELHGDDHMCKLQAAAILSVIAGDLVAEHGSTPCIPVPWPPQWERPDEPLIPHAGSLDREAQLWTDGTGHVWNLALPWADNAGSTWRWYGSIDGQGAPLMRSMDWPEPQPLDALRQLRGPMSPLTEGGAA